MRSDFARLVLKSQTNQIFEDITQMIAEWRLEMKINVFELESAWDETVLSVMMMQPETKPKALVQILHGMSENKERYTDFMEFLVEQGYACIIHDHRGHGDSVKSPRDYGYMGEDAGVALVRDARQVGEFLQDEAPDLPFFVIGHSMGSLVARMLLKKYEKTMDGIILIGSPSNNKAAGIGIILSKILGKVFGEKKHSMLLTCLTFGKHERKSIGGQLNSWICTNPDVVKEYNKSEKCGFTFTYNGYEALYSLVASVYSKKNWKVRKEDMPILFLSGEDDICRGGDKKFFEAIGLLCEVGYENVDCKLYAKMRHEILNETDHQKVYQDIVQALDRWKDRV